MRLKWKLDSVRLEIVPILTQYRCMLCAKHTIGLEIILDAPNDNEAQVETRFISFRDGANLDAR
jgi:hypothetical protein